MERGQEQGFLCRFCGKSFCSGKSLGGHMRGHLALIHAEKSDENDNDDVDFERGDLKKEKKVPRSPEMDPEDFGDASYGLRENPKKSWKISNTKFVDVEKINVCKECGKGFLSLRALSGHMKSHSVNGKEETPVCRECGKEFSSMRAMFGHMRSHSKRSTVSSESDYEIACPIKKKRSRARYNKIISNPSSLNVSSSISLNETDEVKEVAMCLMMLSMGIRSWDEFNFFTDSLKYKDSRTDESRLLIWSKGNTENEDELRVGLDGDEIKKMKKPRQELDSSASGSKCSNFSSEFHSDDEQKAELEVYINESLSCDKFSKRPYIKNELTPTELVKVNFTEDGSSQVDLSLLKTNISNSPEFVDQDLEFKGNFIDDHLKYATADSKFIKGVERSHKFKCRTCDKTFPTYQALGGHRTTHKAADNCTAQNVVNCRTDSELQKLGFNGKLVKREPGEMEVTSYDLRKSKEYECSICLKIFASGQALGGHKRAHYTAPTESRGKEVLLMDQELPDYIGNSLDLEFPATLETESSAIDAGLRPWWAVKDFNCEPLAIIN